MEKFYAARFKSYLRIVLESFLFFLRSLQKDAGRLDAGLRDFDLPLALYHLGIPPDIPDEPDVPVAYGATAGLDIIDDSPIKAANFLSRFLIGF